jgi:hypothetical protein
MTNAYFKETTKLKAKSIASRAEKVGSLPELLAGKARDQGRSLDDSPNTPNPPNNSCAPIMVVAICAIERRLCVA